jgi:hypothetical protein
MTIAIPAPSGNAISLGEFTLVPRDAHGAVFEICVGGSVACLAAGTFYSDNVILLGSVLFNAVYWIVRRRLLARQAETESALRRVDTQSS